MEYVALYAWLGSSFGSVFTAFVKESFGYCTVGVVVS